MIVGGATGAFGDAPAGCAPQPWCRRRMMREAGLDAFTGVAKDAPSTLGSRIRQTIGTPGLPDTALFEQQAAALLAPTDVINRSSKRTTSTSTGSPTRRRCSGSQRLKCRELQINTRGGRPLAEVQPASPFPDPLVGQSMLGNHV